MNDWDEETLAYAAAFLDKVGGKVPEAVVEERNRLAARVKDLKCRL